MRHPWLALPLIASVLALIVSGAHARSVGEVCVGGQCLTQVRVDPQRAGVLRDAATRLQRGGVPSYASVYRSPFKGRRVDQGAILVAAVGSQSWNGWLENIGKVSVGFLASSRPDGQGTGSGYLRVGDQFIDYGSIGSGAAYGRRVGEQMTGPRLGYTEATFLAEPSELKAIMAFYQARANGVILSPGRDGAAAAGLPKEVAPNLPAAGSMVNPQWSMSREGSGVTMKNLATDACAGRASCVLNPNWRRLFAWNVATRLNEIRAYGQQHGIPELAELSADAPKQIDKFMRRYFGSASQHSQSNDPHSMVRKNAIHASVLTAFVDGHPNPLETLTWGLRAQKYKSGRTGRIYPDQNTIQFYQPGQGQLYAVPDWKPGQREIDLQAARNPSSNLFAPPRFDSERIPLQSFLRQLGQGN